MGRYSENLCVQLAQKKSKILFIFTLRGVLIKGQVDVQSIKDLGHFSTKNEVVILDAHYVFLLRTYRMLISMTMPKVTKSNGSFVFKLSIFD